MNGPNKFPYESMPKKKGGRPLKFNSPKKLEKEIEKYFKSCWRQKINKFGDPIFLRDKDGKQTKKATLEQFRPYTVVGLAVFLGCDRHLLTNYEAKDRFSTTIKRAKRRILAYTEERLYIQSNVRGVIFNLKNNWGWNK